MVLFGKVVANTLLRTNVALVATADVRIALFSINNTPLDVILPLNIQGREYGLLDSDIED